MYIVMVLSIHTINKKKDLFGEFYYTVTLIVTIVIIHRIYNLFCVAHNFEYNPPFDKSSLCVPRSPILPFSSTKISSASMTVDNL